MRKFSKVEEEAEINMTPMLDIVFIMLIFFIVTASFVRESGLDVNKPPPDQQEQKQDKKNILIQIDANDRVFVNLRPVDIASAHDAHAEMVVRAYDQARQAGVLKVSIAAPKG